MLKLRPFEKYCGEDRIVSYVGIRADEDRVGYISTKPNITAVFPFKEHGLAHADILRVLEEAGLGLPEYYKWRSRSGCFFCFFQRREEWKGLLEHHPDLFEEAKGYEKVDPETGKRYTWNQRESLDELSKPERLVMIRSRVAAKPPGRSLLDTLSGADGTEDDDDAQPCAICTL